MKSKNIQTEIEEMDQAIRAGKASHVPTLVRKLSQSKIRREDRAPLAAIAWRVNLPFIGVKLLNPLVRPTSKKPVNPTPFEKEEYGVSLIKVGAIEEGRKILEDLEPAAQPRSLLYRAFAHIAQWEYQQSIPLLEQYLGQSNLENYPRLVGEANLAAALVYERKFTASERLLKRFVKKCRDENHQLLLLIEHYFYLILV